MGIFDILTLALFAGLVVLFLQRSVDADAAKDHLWQYLVAACGCALANYVGNQGYPLVAVVLIVATMIFITYVLKPFPNFPFK